MNERKPIPLDKLAEHLRTNAGDAPVVDMGRIIVPQRPYMKWIAALAVVMILCGSGVATYHTMSPKEFTVIVDINQEAPSQALAQIVAESGGEIVAVKQQEGSSTYEIKVATRKSGTTFLEWLRKNKDVKMATKLED